MFIKHDLLSFFENLKNINEESFLIAENCYPIKNFHMQKIKREINSEVISFLSIKNIIIFEEKRNQSFFSTIIFPLINNFSLNICFDDIVNDRLFNFLIKNNYQPFFYIKNNEKIRAAYRLKY